MTRLKPGLYLVEERSCSCGGPILIERVAAQDPTLRWEFFCKRCGAADPNGYPTLREARAEGEV